MICICISENNIDTILTQLHGEEMAEIRLDTMTLTAQEIVTVFSQPLQLMATCRPDKHNDIQRRRLLCAAIDGGAAFVDIEIDLSTPEFREGMIKYAKAKGCKVVLSYHDFKATPAAEVLNSIIKDCFAEGADIAKLACMVNSEADAQRLLDLYHHHSNVVSLGMGDLGQITRIKSLSLGAPFTYAAPKGSTGTASGQMDKDTLLMKMKQL